MDSDRFFRKHPLKIGVLFHKTLCFSAPAPVPAAPQTAGEVTPELVAAVSAALAEELGTDITGIRIVSMKKV